MSSIQLMPWITEWPQKNVFVFVFHIQTVVPKYFLRVLVTTSKSPNCKNYNAGSECQIQKAKLPKTKTLRHNIMSPLFSWGSRQNLLETLCLCITALSLLAIWPCEVDFINTKCWHLNTKHWGWNAQCRDFNFQFHTLSFGI